MKCRLLLAALIVLALFPGWAQDAGGSTGADSSGASAAPPASETGPVEGDAAGPAAGVEAVLDSVEEFAGELEETIAPEKTPWSYAGRMGIALGIIAIQALIIWILWRHVFKFITRKTVEHFGGRIKPFTIKKLKILSTKQIISLVIFGVKIVKYILTLFLLIFTVPVVFALFPGTRDLALTLFGYIFNPFKNIVFGVIDYIPNLITIVVTIIVTRYVLRALKFFTIQIEKEKLVIPGFYADWANPTFNILRVLLYAFTVAIIYPYLPGSDSRIFQGVSVLVGVIFSLGSSSAIGNLVAGLVITYMRPFKIGDRIKINDVTGFVVEKTLMVVRMKTHKNEYVTFPNLMILNSSVVNYHTSSDEDEEGLILYATITFGYGTPWQTVQKILIDAALETPHVLKNPKPFVLQTAMDDFYANYQINCYTKKVGMVPRIYSELYQNIQDGFHAAGIDMTAPHFRINMPYQGPPEETPPSSPAANRISLPRGEG
ncbi:MAG: mechanosensitive ion channel family protein [Treponema sp.]|jgi:small-conductance mechanosensitive channel|nr:mechanosensitive ion channel family protein [Treponema sp.]